jgi:hypothetical protein
MRPRADGHEGAGADRKLVGSNDNFSDSGRVLQALPVPLPPLSRVPVPTIATKERLGGAP